MTTINTTPLALPNNLQKYILNLIISEYRKELKKLIYNSNKIKTKQNELFIGNLIKVNWYWFETIKNFINIISYSQLINSSSVNSNNEKYLIFKYENIKYFKINISDYNNESTIYKTINFLNRCCSNFKRLILNFNCNSINFLKEIKVLGNDHHHSIIINVSITNLSYTEFKKFENEIISNKFKIDKILKLNIDSEIKDKLKFYEFLNNLKFIMYLIPSENTIQPLFKEIYRDVINRNEMNNLKNLFLNNKQYDSIACNSIEQFYYLLKLSPNLNKLSIRICYNNLIYNIERMNGIINNSSKCNCNGDDDEIFKEHWEFISNSIINSKELIEFKIKHCCLYEEQHQEDEEEGSQVQESIYLNKYEFSNEFIISFGSIFKNNKSIKELTINSFHTPQLLEFIFNESSNKTIEKVYLFTYILNNINSNKLKFNKIGNEITKNNNQIKSIKLHWEYDYYGIESMYHYEK